MADDGLNYTPLSTLKASQQKNSFSLSNKTLVFIVVFLTIGVGMVGYLLLLRRPIRKQVPAYLSGEATACDIKLGPPISGLEKVEGSKYSIQVPIENQGNAKKGVRLSTAWFACPYNDKQTCQDGDGHGADQEHILAPKEKKLVTLTAEQLGGACGSLQINFKINAVKKNAGDDDGNGGDKIVINDTGQWDVSCNTNATWVGGFYSFPQACGVEPTTTPTLGQPPTPTESVPTITPTPPTEELTPTEGVEATHTPMPTSVPGETGTPIPTSTPITDPITEGNNPTPTSSIIAEALTATPIPVACGTKACDDDTNPCRNGLICMQANDGSNYCTLPEFETACKENPSQASCCTAPGEPTEIVLVNATSSPAETAVAGGVTEIPSAGIAVFGTIFTAISLGVILLGLIL